MNKEQEQKRTAIILGGLFLILLFFAFLSGGFYIGQSCTGDQTLPAEVDPDTREIDASETQAEKENVIRLEAIETKRKEAIEALEGEQREEYERVREHGPDAVLEWLDTFDRERFRD